MSPKNNKNKEAISGSQSRKWSYKGQISRSLTPCPPPEPKIRFGIKVVEKHGNDRFQNKNDEKYFTNK